MPCFESFFGAQQEDFPEHGVFLASYGGMRSRKYLCIYWHCRWLSLERDADGAGAFQQGRKQWGKPWPSQLMEHCWDQVSHHCYCKSYTDLRAGNTCGHGS
jgi:hypothetical protein